MNALVPVTFFPSGVTALVPEGTTVAMAAIRARVPIETPCGTRGICGNCGVRVVFGRLAEPDEVEQSTLERCPPDVRLACRARIDGPVGVRPLLSGAKTSSRGPAAGRALETVAGVDLGTTNVSALLVETVSGREVSRATVPNLQGPFGSDVLSRLTEALDAGRETMAVAAERSVAQAVLDASDEAGLPPTTIRQVVIAGNTAMATLLVGADASSLARHPFEPPFMLPMPLSPRSDEARAIPALDGAIVLPPIAGFVGGDALAGSLAAGLLDDSGHVRLLVDVGTNAEIVLNARGRITVASAAAGPAFEGWGVSSGGPAGPGSVEHVRTENGEIRLETAGGEPPARFSGAGLVSALAVLRRLNCLDSDGLIVAKCPLAERISRDDHGVVTISLGVEGRSLPLTQLDIRALQLAKAAIRAGIDRVLSWSGIAVDEVDDLLVAGAFGHALVPADAAEIGLVPEGLAGRAHVVGNAALAGAAMIALDPALLEAAQGAFATATHVDLASDADFQVELIHAVRLAP